MIVWDTCIKPLLGGPIASPTCGFNEQDLEKIVKAFNAHSKEILQHDSKHECFYSSYVALVGHYIANCFNKVTRLLYKEFTKTCFIVMDFCLSRLQCFDVQCAVPQKNLMQLLSALTRGDSPFIRVDIITFTAMLRSAEVPEVVNKSGQDTDEQENVDTGTDALSRMFESVDMYSSGPHVATEGKYIVNSAIIEENITSLVKLTKLHDFNKVYRSLQYLKRYFNRLSDLVEGKPITLPDSSTAANTVRSGLGPLSNNISIVLQAVSLPLVENMSDSRIENLCKLGLSCFYAALSVVSAMAMQSSNTVPAASSILPSPGKSKEPDYHSIANSILRDVVNVHNQIETIFSSHGHSGSTLQNYRIQTTYIISKGLWLILNEQNRDAAANPYISALVNTLIIVLQKVLKNADFDVSENTTFTPKMLQIVSTEGNLNILAILKECDVLQLLVTLIQYSLDADSTDATEVGLHKDETEDSGASDDDNLERDDSDNEYSSSCEDTTDSTTEMSNEPVLGEWFLTMLEENDTNAQNAGTFSIPVADNRRQFFLPDEAFIKNEGPAFPEYSPFVTITDILDLLNFQFLSSSSDSLKTFWKENMHAESIVKIASLLKRGNDVNSQALMSLMHKLLSSELLSEETELSILQELGLHDPQKCLYADAKLLSILFKVLLHHQLLNRAQCKDYEKVTTLLSALSDHYSIPHSSTKRYGKGIKVPVIQMCLVLFHSLTDEGKRGFLQSVIKGLRVCEEKYQIPYNSAWLALILEYLLLHFDNPCETLMSQTRWNLVRVFLEPDSSEPPATKFGNFVMTPFSFCKYENERIKKSSLLMPTSDSEIEVDCESVDVDNDFFEVTDFYVNGGKSGETDLSKVLEKNKLDVLELYRLAIIVLNSGSFCKVASVESQKDRFSLIFNLNVGWRLMNLLAPLTDVNDTPMQSLGDCFSAIYHLGNTANSDKKGLVSKMVDTLSILASDLNMLSQESDGVMAEDMFPSHTVILVLDAILHGILNLVHEGSDLLSTSDDIFPVLMKFIGYFSQVARCLVLKNSKLPNETLELVSILMQLEFSGLGMKEMPLDDQIPDLPQTVLTEIRKWKAGNRHRIISNDLTTENVFKAHLRGWNSDEPYLIVLQYVIQSLHTVLARINPWDSISYNGKGSLEPYKVLFSLPSDAIMSEFEDTKSLDYDESSEMILCTLQYQAARKIYDFILDPKSEQEKLERKFSVAFLKFLEKLCGHEDSASVTKVLHHFFVSAKITKSITGKEDPKDIKLSYPGLNLGYSGDFNRLLFTGGQSQEYVFAYFNLLGAMVSRSIGDNADQYLAGVASELNQLSETDDFIKWYETFTEYAKAYNSTDFPKSWGSPMKLVRNLSHPSSPVCGEFALKILEVALPEVTKHINDESIFGFITLLIPLTEAKNGRGHLTFFKNSLVWLQQCQNEIGKMKNFNSSTPSLVSLVNLCELILFYITDVLHVLYSLKIDDQYNGYDEDDDDDDDIIHDDETIVDENEKNTRDMEVETSVEDAELCNKLCTYSISQKEFMNQHWYHCHTCLMTDGIGVCTICARVCHKGHDLTYAKYGSFFCDCGAKGKMVCEALTKRDCATQPSKNVSASSSRTTVSTSAASSTTSLHQAKRLNAIRGSRVRKVSVQQRFMKRTRLCRNLDDCKVELNDFFKQEKDRVLRLLLDIIDILEKNVTGKEYDSMLPNRTAFALRVMEKLHNKDKNVVITEDLVVATLGSQEGSFENVKANFAGEQGQTIRQLINSKVISRVAMSCLSSGHGKWHHLAVSHDKSKLTVLQLSALLKQSDASKRKLTLTRLSTTQIPFSIVTICSNPCNKEVLAVCGLKDCRIITFTVDGAANEQFNLHLPEPAGNYIIKAVWLPGSATEIALVTAKYVAIYNLAVDVLAPTFNLVIPTSKVRDATFAVVDDVTFLIIMSSSGYLYAEALLECCSAQYGPFYVTSVLQVNSDTVQEKNDEFGGGGVSVYYSHNLQMLFFSYGNGRNFTATVDLKCEDYQLAKLFPIDFQPSTTKSVNNSSVALHGWSEIHGHPGLLTCFTHTNAAPVAIMVKPYSIHLQELKSTGKSRMQDLVAVRHSPPGDVERSTLIALCEDGSLKIFFTSVDNTEFWLHPNLQPRSVFCRQVLQQRPIKRTEGLQQSAVNLKEDQVEKVFPLDFFEDCQVIGQNDLEFGGDSLLQVYNPQQINDRLAYQDMYIVSKKSFAIEITIKQRNTVMTGVRIQVGSRGNDFAPTHVYIGDRYISLGPRLKKPRWFDFPLTREETLRYKNKLVVTIGMSVHPDDYTIVDSIKVYGKTKEKFVWVEEEAKEAAAALEKLKLALKKKEKEAHCEPEVECLPVKEQQNSMVSMNPTDRIVNACLHSLNCTFTNDAGSSGSTISEEVKTRILNLSGKLLVSNLPYNVSKQLKKLMMNVLPDLTDYHNFKDMTILNHVRATLGHYKTAENADKSMKKSKFHDMQADEYQSLLVELRRVVVRRPRSLLSVDICLNWPPSQAFNNENCIVISDFWDILLDMIARKPTKPMVTPPCLPGIQNINSTVQALVDIMHSTAMTVPGTLSGACFIYYNLLTSDQIQVSSAARSALLRLLCFPELTVTTVQTRNARAVSQTDSSPSTRSNSPPSAAVTQSMVTTLANTSNGILSSSSRNIPNVADSSNPMLMEEFREYGLLKEEGSGDSDGDEFEDDDDDDDDDEDDDDDQHIEDEIIAEERGNGIAPSLNREEQLRAMQALEQNIVSRSQQQHRTDGSNNEVVDGEAQPNDDSAISQMQNEMQRLEEIMHASENQNFFDDSMMDDMMMDVQEDEFPDFEGDDEAMVEYAIALSLQQSGGASASNPPSQVQSSETNNPPNQQQSQQPMQNAPAERDESQEQTPSIPESNIEKTGKQSENADHDEKSTVDDSEPVVPPSKSQSKESVFSPDKIEKMRCDLISNLISQLPRIFELPTGQQSIPYFQVLIALTKFLDPTKESQKALLTDVVTKLSMIMSDAASEEEFKNISQRSVYKEVATNIIKCLVILISDNDHHDMISSALTDENKGDTMGSMVANALLTQNVIENCIVLLDEMHDHWNIGSNHGSTEGDNLLKLMKAPVSTTTPDFSPFILAQHVKAHPTDVFENYAILMTEALLHLPYRLSKWYNHEKVMMPEHLKAIFSTNPLNEGNLPWILSDYMLSSDIPMLKKRVRKILVHFCGTREIYKETRDIHALSRYLQRLTETWKEASVMSKLGTTNFPYDKLISIVKDLNACLAVAMKRTSNWQKSCISSNWSCMNLLLEMSVYITEDIASSVLQLLMHAVSVKKKSVKDKKAVSKPDPKATVKAVDAKMDESKDKIEENDDMANQLCVKFLTDISESDLRAFLMRFLLEINITAVRWDAHEFVLQLYKNTNTELRSKLIASMWTLWPVVSEYGRKSVQFVDLLGYISIKNGIGDDNDLFIDATLDLLKKQNKLLVNHPNSMLYMQLANYVDFDGYFLESNPCLICNQREIPYQMMKLSSVKADTKFTTTQQIIKLVGSYSLQRVNIKITDIKQTKMIRTATLFYNNKTVPAIIELKNKPKLWHKAKEVVLTQCQNEVRFDLPLPVVATNLMLQFGEFYENVSTTTETLQCPRCSGSVQANPGICESCGENVFQCHKCRSINYDEKDPYLCNVCGFSKYAKFDVSLLARPCCAVDAITNEDDRKKMVGVVSALLEKADRTYYQMLAYKPELEHLLLQIEKLSGPMQKMTKLPNDGRIVGNAPYGSRIPVLNSSGQVGNAPPGPSTLAMAASQGLNVNMHIRQLAQKYCVDAKNSFGELSKIMKTVLASRKEIVEYDQRQKIAVAGGRDKFEIDESHVETNSNENAKTCYGCAAATAKQCIILLRGLTTDPTAQKRLVENGLITELVHVSLRRGNSSTRKQVQQLIGQLVKNDPSASAELNNIILSRITSGMLHYYQDLFPAAISSEMNLLVSILDIQDHCWQSRFKVVVQLFQMSIKMKSPAITENVTLPCLQMLQSKVGPIDGEFTSQLITATKGSKENTVDARSWLANEKGHDFYSWKENQIKCDVTFETADKDKSQIHEGYLIEKYARKWRKFVLKKKNGILNMGTTSSLMRNRWLRQMLFCKSSRAVRLAACSIVEILTENTSRKGLIIDMLTNYLDELCHAGDCAEEFFQMYQTLIKDPQWKVRLAGREVLHFIGNLIDQEISSLLKLEETSLSLDLQQGYPLKQLTKLITSLMQVQCVRLRYKSSMVGTVLNSYLSLRKLVIQRTTIIDETQEMLLELLEDLTTGTESETKAFMAVCIETINKYEMSDIRTPQFIFERLANIIIPEESNTNEFFMSLDKDPLQEDFLQGRMVGNPYSSNEVGLGPLMRDVKNKICRDCDLVALLEDDSGMELLVNNKIIGLDLAVRDVYNKVWIPSHDEDEAMRVIYRMRGLLGEATEDMIDKLDPEVDNRDEEEVYKMSRVLNKCGGIESMLQRLDTVQNLTHGRQLVDAILKLMTYAVHLKSNRKYFLKPELNTLNVLLGTLNLGLQSGEDGVPLVEQLLVIMDRILQETGDDKNEVFTGDKEKLTLLLQQIHSELVRRHSKVLRGIMKITPFLSFGDPDLMQMLIDHFKSVLDFEKFDENHSDEDNIYLDCFCEISTGIGDDDNGDKLKRLIINNNIVSNALMYISSHIPQHKKFESEDWKEFLSRPALPYCLRLLTGLSKRHEPTQEIIGKISIPDLHRLEQVSTEGSIGSLAENVLEAVSEHFVFAKLVKEVRRETRAEKKRLAMAMRQKELGALGMKTNAKGQVVTKTSILEEIGDLVEESGLTCIICREGYKFEPKKVLGVYTFSRRCPLEEFENKSRKQHGYSTVSHFNVVHYDCHTSAVRAARGREEWESAMLQNANTKCNGLLPIWGPHVPESGFTTCLARHNTYLQHVPEATGYKEPNVTSTAHDLKLLLLRFAQGKSFSEETGGGGPQSNVHLIPYMIHMAQYVINTTRSSQREERAITVFLDSNIDKWVESSYSVDGPLYVATIFIFVRDHKQWLENREMFLKRLLVLAQARHTSRNPISKITDAAVKSYDVYKPYLLFWSLLDLLYTILFKGVFIKDSSSTWAQTLQNYIRNNDPALQDTSEKMVVKFQQEYLPISTFDEFTDVAGLHDLVNGDLSNFLSDLLDSLPK